MAEPKVSDLDVTVQTARQVLEFQRESLDCSRFANCRGATCDCSYGCIMRALDELCAERERVREIVGRVKAGHDAWLSCDDSLPGSDMLDALGDLYAAVPRREEEGDG